MTNPTLEICKLFQNLGHAYPLCPHNSHQFVFTRRYHVVHVICKWNLPTWHFNDF